MKPQEAELVSEISKLQSMVCELKLGFSSALSELNQIQSSDAFLRDELEENRRSCHKRRTAWRRWWRLSGQTYVKFVEQLLQRQLLFRNTLQERLSAEHWKSLIGDILVQLIGQNDSSFSDMYLGYTTTLASFLSLEFNRLKQKSDHNHKSQSCDLEREEMKLLSLLLAPVSRIHGYLSHIQSLLQWTGKDHPDCSLLLGSERALRSLLSQCHQILERDVQWEEPEATRSHIYSAAVTQRSLVESQETAETSLEQKESQLLQTACPVLSACGVSVLQPCPSKIYFTSQTLPSLLLPAPAHPPRASSQLLGREQRLWTGHVHPQPRHGRPRHRAAGRDTDVDDDTFDYSSVTTCSPDQTLRRDSEDEEDSHVPVLLKPERGR
ncbi:hypothetical protein WMY93_017758 [Mugilogobius chulae]|uniref:DH domain-containing protein n=1 Tax=Mugilogobius chulae TaxID=88201 RepID=A0AAW0NWA1_9GOBI